MREKMRDSSESPSAQYEQLLKTSVALHANYRAMGERISKLEDEGKDADAERVSRDRHKLDKKLNQLMEERVALVRQLEGLTTIEEAFPRVKTLTKAEKSDLDATDIIEAFNGGRMTHEQLRAAATKIVGTSVGEELSDSELRQFCDARYALARKLGYKTGYDHHSAAENAAPSAWMMLQKDGIAFELKHFAFPSNFGIMGSSRISSLRVTTGRAKGDKFTEHLAYDRSWDEACDDPRILREIDRVAAILA